MDDAGLSYSDRNNITQRVLRFKKQNPDATYEKIEEYRAKSTAAYIKKLDRKKGFIKFQKEEVIKKEEAKENEKKAKIDQDLKVKTKKNKELLDDVKEMDAKGKSYIKAIKNRPSYDQYVLPKWANFNSIRTESTTTRWFKDNPYIDGKILFSNFNGVKNKIIEAYSRDMNLLGASQFGIETFMDESQAR